MPERFSCPSCGAALDYDAAQPSVRCAHCGSVVVMPQPADGGSAPDPLLPDPTLSEVAALFRAGKRVQATIRYREVTGAGLKEARQALDRFAAGEPLRRPNLLERGQGFQP